MMAPLHRLHRESPDGTCLRWLCLLLLAAYALTMAGRVSSGDGEAMYQTTRALLTRGQLAIERRPESAPGRGGRYYSKYGVAQSLVEAPFYVAGAAAGKLFRAGDDTPARFAVGLTNGVVTAALVAVLWLTLRELGTGRGAATAGALIAALATPLWPYARSDFAEPLQAAALLLVFYAATRYRRVPHAAWAALSGAAGGVAFLTKAASVVVLLPLALYFAWALLDALQQRRSAGRGDVPARREPQPPRERHQRPPPAEAGRWRSRLRGVRPDAALVRHLLAAAAPFLACALVQAALNLYRFGKVTEFGYGDEPATGFTTPVLVGIHHLLISSGKGLFWFAPPVLVGLAGLPWLARRRPAAAAAAGAVFLMELLYFARWWAWHGDWCWGPRYMVVTIPFVMLGWAPLLSSWRTVSLALRATAALVVAAGVVVSALGVLVDYGAYFSVVGSQLGRGVDVRDARLVPEFSPIPGHTWLVEASLYDTLTGRNSAARPEDAQHNPFRRAYPWAATHPDLVPEAPERAFGFDLWFATLAAREDRSPFSKYWGTMVATWLALALLPLTGRLWRAARPGGSGVYRMPEPAHAGALESVPA